MAAVLLSVEDLFLAGLGFDIAGGYLVSRGLLRPVPQLAKLGGTVWALEQSKGAEAINDRIRGTVGLGVLVFGFSVQAVAYALVLQQAPVNYGAGAAAVGLVIAFVIAVGVPLLERVVRPCWRRRIAIRVARFDYEGSGAPRSKPLANVLLAFGEELGDPRRDEEDAVAYVQRIWHVDAD